MPLSKWSSGRQIDFIHNVGIILIPTMNLKGKPTIRRWLAKWRMRYLKSWCIASLTIDRGRFYVGIIWLIHKRSIIYVICHYNSTLVRCPVWHLSSCLSVLSECSRSQGKHCQKIPPSPDHKRTICTYLPNILWWVFIVWMPMPVMWCTSLPRESYLAL